MRMLNFYLNHELHINYTHYSDPILGTNEYTCEEFKTNASKFVSAKVENTESEKQCFLSFHSDIQYIKGNKTAQESMNQKLIFKLKPF